MQDEVSEPEAERLWALEAQKRLEALHAGLVNAVPASEVAKKAERLFR